MQQVEYRAQASGGYYRVHRYEQGKQVGQPFSFNSKSVAQRVARELNFAIGLGVGLAEDAVLNDLTSGLGATARRAASESISRAVS